MKLTTDEDLAQAQAFFKDKDTAKFNLSYLQALDSIRASSAWLKRSEEDVSGWLARYNKA